MFQTDRDWRPPAELQRPGPRPVRLAGRGIGLSILMVFIIIFGFGTGALMTYKSQSQQRERQLLDSEGRPADGTVLRLWRTNDKSVYHMVQYRFTAEGRDITASRVAPQHLWNTLHVDDPIQIRYVPSDPAIN